MSASSGDSHGIPLLVSAQIVLARSSAVFFLSTSRAAM